MGPLHPRRTPPGVRPRPRGGRCQPPGSSPIVPEERRAQVIFIRIDTFGRRCFAFSLPDGRTVGRLRSPALALRRAAQDGEVWSGFLGAQSDSP